MALVAGTEPIWDVEQALRRMEKGHYSRYLDTYRRVAVMANALAGLTFTTLYRNPAREIVNAIQANMARAGMVSEKLLSAPEQQTCLGALQALDAALAGEAPALDFYTLCTAPISQYPKLQPLFVALDGASPHVCVPFIQQGYDPAVAKPALDAFLALVGDTRTLADLYEKAPSFEWKADFNRTMVAARRAGLLVDLRGLRKPSAAGYVSDPQDDRWDVRSCVPPENAELFKDVHLRINTMAYLMAGLTYGDFFDLPMVDDKVMPHFKRRVANEPGYWFSALERERIVAALDALLGFLNGGAHKDLTLREVYTNPDVPAEVLIQFQRILDVKPEICLPFMHYSWDHAEIADAIEPFLSRNRDRTLKQLYSDPPQRVKETYTQSEYELLLKQRAATKRVLAKYNDLYCFEPGDCRYMDHDYCSSGVFGNCEP